MTKFKVGDRVLIPAVIRDICKHDGLHHVELIGGTDPVNVGFDEEQLISKDTTFRDQAAIAYMAALAIADHLTYEQTAVAALKAAVHLEEQRNRLEGVK